MLVTNVTCGVLDVLRSRLHTKTTCYEMHYIVLAGFNMRYNVLKSVTSRFTNLAGKSGKLKPRLTRSQLHFIELKSISFSWIDYMRVYDSMCAYFSVPKKKSSLTAVLCVFNGSKEPRRYYGAF